MQLDVFTAPQAVTCVLCRATVSVRKGDKARFFNHISHDHEVHYDMELFYVLSYLDEKEKETVISLINQKLLGNSNQGSDKEDEFTDTLDAGNMSSDEGIDQSTGSSESQAENHSEESEITIEETAEEESQSRVKEVNHSTKNGGTPVNSTKTISRPKTIECKFCEKRVREGSNMSRHMKIVHNIGKSELEKLKLTVDDKIRALNKSKIQLQNVKKEPIENTNKSSMEIPQDSPLLAKPIESVLKMIQDNDRNKVETNNATPRANEDGYRNCKICFIKVKNTYYKRHLQTVHSGRLHPCALCYFSFCRKDNLKHHHETVHKDDLHFLDEEKNPKFSKSECKFQCSKCNKKFISDASLKFHTGKKHGAAENGKKCSKCDKKFVNVKKHELICKVALMP